MQWNGTRVVVVVVMTMVVMVAMVAMMRESCGGDGASGRPCYRCGTVGTCTVNVKGPIRTRLMWWQYMDVVAVANDVCGGQWWRLIVASTTFLVGNGGD